MSEQDYERTKDKGLGKYFEKVKEFREEGISYKSNGEEEFREPPLYWPLLVLKNSPEDDGTRPLENPTWHPPCIRIETYRSDGSPGDPIINPQA